MSSMTERLAGESSAKHFKLPFEIRTIQFRDVSIYGKLVHPSIPLPLLKNIRAETVYLHTGATLVTKYFTAIDTSSYPGKKVELAYIVLSFFHLTFVFLKAWIIIIHTCNYIFQFDVTRMSFPRLRKRNLWLYISLYS